jgi:hypothetical protein
VSPWSSWRGVFASDDPAASVRREDAERFVEEVRGDDPKLASYLRIEERELEAGGPELADAPPG